MLKIGHYGVTRAKDWVSEDCGTNSLYTDKLLQMNVHYESRRD